MTRQLISPEQFLTRPYDLWEHQWLVLTSGDFAAGRFNGMTVAWGAFGSMWARPFAQVVVRPQRYTFEFMEAYPTFTVCAFPAAFRPALNIMGTKSGRQLNKIAEAGLTPIASSVAAAPGYAEAELIVECRKLYWDDMEAGHFLEPDLAKSYPSRDYHRIFYGEILAIWGEAKYQGG
jgi:flavin reductase (DIM6/NTAB) family NADH-FMN oxidoreductase RutF